MITNAELNNYSVSELRELNHKVVEMIKMKQHIAGKLNSDNIKKGDIVRVNSTSGKIEKDEKFEVIKINRTTATCRMLSTKSLWTINLANIIVD